MIRMNRVVPIVLITPLGSYCGPALARDFSIEHVTVVSAERANLSFCNKVSLSAKAASGRPVRA